MPADFKILTHSFILDTNIYKERKYKTLNDLRILVKAIGKTFKSCLLSFCISKRKLQYESETSQ